MKASASPYVRSSAVTNALYRYHLQRVWDETLPRCNFVMLNPSTADALGDDPTIRRCVGFARKWGFGTLEVTNLFALRATDPRQLRTSADPIGAYNDTYILSTAALASLIVVAWGTHGVFMTRGREVLEILRPFKPKFFDLTRNCQPVHPLYQRSDAPLFTLLPENSK